uniref:Uncharacterized protein n=1 Tax=Amphimedon queenslandica TaxID=400682 RepID=A0A1X7TG77_AMPQE
MREKTEFHEYNPFYGWTPLILAARNGSTQVVTMLLEKGADVAASTDTYKRPVGIDIFFGMEDILR